VALHSLTSVNHGKKNCPAERASGESADKKESVVARQRWMIQKGQGKTEHSGKKQWSKPERGFHTKSATIDTPQGKRKKKSPELRKEKGTGFRKKIHQGDGNLRTPNYPRRGVEKMKKELEKRDRQRKREDVEHATAALMVTRR